MATPAALAGVAQPAPDSVSHERTLDATKTNTTCTPLSMAAETAPRSPSVAKNDRAWRPSIKISGA